MRAAPNYQNPTNDYSDANDANIESLLRLFVLRAGPQIASITIKQKLEIRKLLGYLDS